MSTDDEDQGHSINDDYRMAGLRGDDETDLEDDREELFGSAAVPVEVGATAGGGAQALPQVLPPVMVPQALLPMMVPQALPPVMVPLALSMARGSGMLLLKPGSTSRRSTRPSMVRG
jgi:hypothetical protein